MLDIVFDGPPGPEAGRFVEVERNGESVSFGEWVRRDDGYWVLRIPDYHGMWESLKTALSNEFAFEAGLFSDPGLRYSKLCEGEVTHERGPIDMIWLHLNALHKAIQACMWRLENGEDPMLEEVKRLAEYQRMMEAIDGFRQGT